MVLYKHSDEPKGNAPISSSLFSQLQKDILTGKLKPGQKLTEQAICKEYKVSRTPVREALRQLEMDGLVENILNRGSFVIGLSQQDFVDMFQLRKIYEIQAVKWAIERITDDEMDALEETFEFMEFYTLRNDVDKMLTINAGFHQIIYEASHNRMLRQLLSSYQTYFKYRSEEDIYANNYLTEVLEEHRLIFKAFTEKDVEAGAEAMERHIDNSKKRRCKQIDNMIK
ncbi:GntR family transcriptional regulator [Zhenpiania hominis]|uniref:GntR family transcriptional regulator n=1 Tax=Zhenpiania hominis TaxID=2763644 RepID=A0A923NJL0_9FIRM|nr:GntR family transcriptional regulator [Zhenpiania hominis]MBC6680281.1 GntR family transcriptional regulator [Zhenpiania hominis]